MLVHRLNDAGIQANAIIAHKLHITGLYHVGIKSNSIFGKND